MEDQTQLIDTGVIRLRSIETRLQPLIKLISTLVHHRGGGSSGGGAGGSGGGGGPSDRQPLSGASAAASRAIGRVGQAVSLAVERFVCVGETIGDDNPEIRQDMYEACKEARSAGVSIEQLCEIAFTDPLGYPPAEKDRLSMVRAARVLLQNVTRVLLLADIVVVKQLMVSKDKVAKSLGRLESVANFTEFVKAFSVFGAEMVELAHVTGDRQNDLKDERRRAQMAAARQVLERSTLMLLTSSKTCLRHPDCPDARENRDTVFCQMRRAMDLIHYVIKDGVVSASGPTSGASAQCGSGGTGGSGGGSALSQSTMLMDQYTGGASGSGSIGRGSSCLRASSSTTTLDWDLERPTASSTLRHFSRLMEAARPRFAMDEGPMSAAVAATSAALAVESGSGGGSLVGSPSMAHKQQQQLQDISLDSGSGSGSLNGSGRPKELLGRSHSQRDRHHHRHHHQQQYHHHHGHGNHGSRQTTPQRNYLSSQLCERDLMTMSATSAAAAAAATSLISSGGTGTTTTAADLLDPSAGDVVLLTSRNEVLNVETSVLVPQMRDDLMAALDRAVEKTQDFTDSAYTTHEHRENILLLCDRVRLELNQCLRMAVNMEQFPNAAFDIDSAVDAVLAATGDLSNQLCMAVADQTAELGSVIQMGVDLVCSLRGLALNQELDRLQERAERFQDYIDHIMDVCKLLRHIALTERLHVQVKFTEINLRIYGPQVITAARALLAYPSSKLAKENLEVFSDMWQWLAGDVSAISKEIIDVVESLGKPDRIEYLSLPRPGKHGTTAKPLKPPAQLDAEEQEMIAKTGEEMKMMTSEMDAETDKWNGETEENNDIVKRAKNMSSMAYSMYQFTKGEGVMRTTQDLFTQAEYFAEEANRLYKLVRQFSYQVPAGDSKKDLLDQLDQVPTHVQTLQFTVKEPTVGKAATFVKVDHVIRETKNLMNVINKVVTTCFECASKFKLDFVGLAGRAAAGGMGDLDGTGAADSKGASTSSEGSM